MKIKGILIALLIFASSAHAQNLVLLNEKNFAAQGASKAIVIVQINWGRAWGCAGKDNAQLISLSFIRQSDTGDANSRRYLSFETPSKISPQNGFKPYVLLIEPGRYELASFEVKVAESKTEIGYIKADEEKLMVKGKSLAGSFFAESGEFVYLGHVGLDCALEPIPWRYYIEGKGDFRKYAEEFKAAYPYLSGKKLLFRIIDTDELGRPYSLGDSFGVQL